MDDAFVGLLPAIRRADDNLRLVYVGRGAAPARVTAYEALRASGEQVFNLGGGGDDMAGIFYTGGTTGRPKGVLVAHTALVVTLMSAQVGPEAPKDASLLCVLQMFHMAGAQLAIVAAMTMRPLIIHPTFDPVAVLACIETDRVDTLSLVPAMWAMLVDHPAAANADLSGLRRVMYGASPMPEGILRRVAARLPGVAEHPMSSGVNASMPSWC